MLPLLVGCAGKDKAAHNLPEGSMQARYNAPKDQWRCDGDTDQRWHCHNAAAANSTIFSSALLSAKTKSASDPAEITETVQQAPDADIDIADPMNPSSEDNYSETVVSNTSDFNDIPDEHFAVQLIAAGGIRAIARYQQEHPYPATRSLQTMVNGKRWYIVLLGIYPTYEAANLAISAMTPAAASPPWIRAIGPLKKSLVSAL